MSKYFKKAFTTVKLYSNFDIVDNTGSVEREDIYRICHELTIGIKFYFIN